MNQGFIENIAGQGQIRAEISLFNQAFSKGKRVRIFSLFRKIFSRANCAQHSVDVNRDKPVKLSGIQSVSIKKIQPNEMKDKNFDENFHPVSKQSQHRWMSVARARMNNVSLPPVELQIDGDSFIVLDGHHRISVAKALGEQYIDAKVRVLS